MGEQKVLFCPFCRESFEGERSCPEHDLPLVPFDKLPIDPLAEHDDEVEPGPSDDTPLALFEWRYGRGLVAIGAVLNGLALTLEFVGGVRGSAGLKAYEVAVTAPSLWTLSLVSVSLLVMLQRRRTPRGLRSLRVLVPGMGVISLASVAWVLYRLHQGAAVWVSGGRKIGLTLGPAIYVVVLAAGLIFAGSYRLGTAPTPKPQ
jgi:hypothetical protein